MNSDTMKLGYADEIAFILIDVNGMEVNKQYIANLISLANALKCHVIKKTRLKGSDAQ